jgi:hypothetical protein
METLQENIKDAKNYCQQIDTRQIELENLRNDYLDQSNQTVENSDKNFEEQTSKFLETFEMIKTNLIKGNEKSMNEFKEVIVENTTNAVSDVKKMINEYAETRNQMEVEILQGKLREAEHKNDKIIMEQQINELKIKLELQAKEFSEANLKSENEKLQLKLESAENIATLKIKFQDENKALQQKIEEIEEKSKQQKLKLEQNFKNLLNEVVNQKLKDFKNELMNEFQP